MATCMASQPPLQDLWLCSSGGKAKALWTPSQAPVQVVVTLKGCGGHMYV